MNPTEERMPSVGVKGGNRIITFRVSLRLIWIFNIFIIIIIFVMKIKKRDVYGVKFPMMITE